jgi:hypothetical protein
MMGEFLSQYKNFRMQERVIRVIMGHGKRHTGRNLFKELKMLPFISQYMFSLVVFVANNRDQFLTNSEIHSTNTRWFKYDRDYLCVNKSQFVPVIFEPPCTTHGSNPYAHLKNLDMYHKCIHYSSIKICNSIPSTIEKYSDNPRTCDICILFLYFNNLCMICAWFYGTL